MQWRKAIEEAKPQQHYFCKVLNKITGFWDKDIIYKPSVPGWDLQSPFEVIEWLDDETPTTPTGWPGEKAITQSDQYNDMCLQVAELKSEIAELKSHTAPTTDIPKIAFPDMKCSCIGEVLQKWGITPLAELVDEIEDLTAPKAEEPHRSAEEIWNIHVKNGWTFKESAIKAMEEYANQFKQSTSIKRPTDAEINEAANKKYPEWMLAAGPRKSGFIDAINWLLSLQSDK